MYTYIHMGTYTLSSESAIKDPEDCWPFHAEVPAHPEMQDVVQCLSLSVGEVEGLVAQGETRTDWCKTLVGLSQDRTNLAYSGKNAPPSVDTQHDYEILPEHNARWCLWRSFKGDTSFQESVPTEDWRQCYSGSGRTLPKWWAMISWGSQVSTTTFCTSKP